MSVPSACPRCAQPTLVQAEHDGRTMLACTRCAGVWLDTADAEGLLAPLTDLHDRTAAYPPLACPRCGAAMPAQYSAMANVEVDRCQAHGAWFDRDEVAHITHAIARMRGEPPPQLPAPYVQGAGVSVGAATAGVAVGVASAALAVAAGAQDQPHSNDHSGDAAEAIGAIPDAVGLAAEGAAATAEGIGEAAGGAVEAIASAAGAVDVGDVASGALEVGGAVLEGAGEILGAVLGGIAEVLGGL